MGALTGLDERAVFDTLLQRERLGSTGIGEGIAIPHGSRAALAHLFLRAARQADRFRGLDGQPVDILFLLLAPEAGADHLKALARVARRCASPACSTASARPATPTRSTPC